MVASALAGGKPEIKSAPIERNPPPPDTTLIKPATSATINITTK